MPFLRLFINCTEIEHCLWVAAIKCDIFKKEQLGNEVLTKLNHLPAMPVIQSER